MANQGPGNGPEWWDRASDPDDLDRAFGPDTGSVATPSTAQRVRRGTVVAVAVVAVAVVLAVVLSTLVGSIQTGVGGVFPQPQAALDRFGSLAGEVDGVQEVRDGDTEKRSFASYDVSAVVVLAQDGSEGAQLEAVRGLSRAVADADGNGVRVTAEARFGTVRVGVTSDAEASARRLQAARAVATIGGVAGVRATWSTDGPSDEPADQTVEVVTGGTGRGLGAVMVVATQRTHAVLPQATLTSAKPTD